MKDSKPVTLGHFEQLVLSAVLALNGKDSHGRNIGKKTSEFEKKEVNQGSVYVTLERLKEKGLVTSELSDPTPIRGGRRRAFYYMTPEGEIALSESLLASVRAYDATETFWEKLKELGRHRI